MFSFFHALKRLTPRSLFGRSLLIIVSPLVGLQLITTYIFYDMHWDVVSQRLSQAVAGDFALVIDSFERSAEPMERARILAAATRATGAAFSFDLHHKLHGAEGRRYGFIGEPLAAALTERVRRPFLIDERSMERYVGVEVQLEDGVLRAVVSRKRLYSSTTYVLLLWMLGVSVLLAAVASVFMRNQVRPIRRLAAAAERFGRGLDVGRFKPEGATEVRRAGFEFNRMRERITRQMEQRTEMLAGVSHDLRTPLTRFKLQLAMMGDRPEVAELQADVAEMEAMLAAYLSFVRGEGAEPARDCDLAQILEEVVEAARRSGATIALDIADPMPVTLKLAAIRRALDNLVGNACRHGDRVAVSGRSRPGSVEVLIDDDGPGIPEARREEAFKPFKRLDPSRNSATGGVGLGLAVARDLVRGHGGDIWLDQSPMGGLRAVVRLPTAQ